MTATQPDPDGGMTRRGVMRRTAIGIGAAATLGATASTSVAAVNLPSRETVVSAAGFALSPPLWGAKQIYDRVTDTATGEDIQDDLSELNAEETNASVIEDGKYIVAVDSNVLTSMGNVINGLDRGAYQRGIERAIVAMNGGDDKTTVKTKAKDKAESYIAKTEKNLLDHWGVQTGKLVRLSNEVRNTSNLDINNAIAKWNGGSKIDTLKTMAGTTSQSWNLVDGTTYGYQSYTEQNDGFDPDPEAFPQDSSQANVWRNDVNADVVTLFDEYPYGNRMEEIKNIASTVRTEIDTWVDGIYPNYTAGEIDLSNVVTADQLAATASEQNDLSNVTADFATLGIPINNKTKLTVEIVGGPNGGTVIDGNLSVSNPPSDGFVVGEMYYPDNIPGPVWLMYNRTKESGETVGDVYELKNSFKVIDAEGYDGEPISNVTFEDKTNERYSTDVQTLNEELDKLAEYQQEIQEERDALIEEAAGGGGGFLSAVGQGYSTGILALGAAGVAWLLSKN